MSNLQPKHDWIGKTVHYVQKNSPEHCPGIICYVHAPGALRSNFALDGTLINVGAWDPRGFATEGIEGIPEDQTAQRPMSWHWPEGTESEARMTKLAERVEAIEGMLSEGGDSSPEDSEPEPEDDAEGAEEEG